ncbi:hypothetical protein QBC37DRAFT_447569 [Rhypophila decipiens]|uniref:Uncharacterized protein n=1 Tax=Rhypophila decipiens TaxID=261697 RepID=A0AAN6Y209_9PEZI|nr:hypothetical protein QBC37DRAFT_447569 [Rhypophila decipiens]
MATGPADNSDDKVALDLAGQLASGVLDLPRFFAGIELPAGVAARVAELTSLASEVKNKLALAKMGEDDDEVDDDSDDVRTGTGPASKPKAAARRKAPEEPPNAHLPPSRPLPGLFGIASSRGYQRMGPELGCELRFRGAGGKTAGYSWVTIPKVTVRARLVTIPRRRPPMPAVSSQTEEKETKGAAGEPAESRGHGPPKREVQTFSLLRPL